MPVIRGITSKNLYCLGQVAYLIHAADDNIALVEQSLVYYQALHRNKVPSQMMVYQQGGHGFSVYNKPLDDFWTKGVVNWLKLNKLL